MIKVTINRHPLKLTSIYSPCTSTTKKGSIVMINGIDNNDYGLVSHFSNDYDVLLLDVYGYSEEIQERWKNLTPENWEDKLTQYGQVETWNDIKEMLEYRKDKNYEIEIYRQTIKELKEKGVEWPINCSIIGRSLGCIAVQRISRSDLKPKAGLYNTPVINYYDLERDACKQIYFIASKDQTIQYFLSKKIIELTGANEAKSPSEQTKEIIDQINKSNTDYMIHVMGHQDHFFSHNPIQNFQILTKYIEYFTIEEPVE